MILGILTLAFMIAFSLILAAIKFSIAGDIEVQKILFEQREKELKVPQLQVLEKNLIAVNQALSQLEDFYQNQTNMATVLEKIVKTIPQGVYLTNISVYPQSKNEEAQQINCSLAGYAPNGESLFELKKNIEKEAVFEEVDFPASNWVKSADIDFFVSFKTRK